MTGQKLKSLTACLACLLAGWICGHSGIVPLRAEPATLVKPTPAREKNPAFPMSARIGSNLYLQTSAEFQACCRQIYRCATERLKSQMSNASARFAKPAVVMDLDETVFDNSSFQTFLLRSGLEYTEELWDQYERDHPQDVTPVPGALEFIRNAGNLGVHVVFLSNRSERFRDSTRSALKRLGLGIVPEERLLLKPTGASSDKTARRKIVASQFDVLMYIGDGLRDFSEEFAGPKVGPSPSIEQCRNAIAHRLTAMKAAEPHLGVDWFVIPNPVYGEWDKFAGPDPVVLLHPTTMPIPSR